MALVTRAKSLEKPIWHNIIYIRNNKAVSQFAAIGIWYTHAHTLNSLTLSITHKLTHSTQLHKRANSCDFVKNFNLVLPRRLGLPMLYYTYACTRYGRNRRRRQRHVLQGHSRIDSYVSDICIGTPSYVICIGKTRLTILKPTRPQTARTKCNVTTTHNNYIRIRYVHSDEAHLKMSRFESPTGRVIHGAHIRARPARSHIQSWDLLITLSRNINHKHTYTHSHVYKYPTYALSQVFQCVSPQSSFGVRP